MLKKLAKKNTIKLSLKCKKHLKKWLVIINDRG
nr:MAG TPA: hypothetical protein [Caudoviricetes sp.]DAZ19763.1 MAG TPA: hypothetical protein [Caudoviricetes sp.]